MNTSEKLYKRISDEMMPNTLRPELGAVTRLIHHTKAQQVEFSLNWYEQFVVSFRPQTIGIKYTKEDTKTKEKKSLSKSVPLEQENLLETILELTK